MEFQILSEKKIMRDNINYLRRNNISVFESNGKYRGYDAIMEDVIRVENSKFENS